MYPPQCLHLDAKAAGQSLLPSQHLLGRLAARPLGSDVGEKPAPEGHSSIKIHICATIAGVLPPVSGQVVQTSALLDDVSVAATYPRGRGGSNQMASHTHNALVVMNHSAQGFDLGRRKLDRNAVRRFRLGDQWGVFSRVSAATRSTRQKGM